MSENKIHPVVCYGETLWDMLPAGRQAGGAPMNVAYQLQKLGKNPAVISKVGSDSLGNELLQRLGAKGVCTDFIQVDHTKPTSVVLAEAKSALEMSYTIVEDVAWDYIELQQPLFQLVQQAKYFVFGSLAARSKQSCETLMQLLNVADKKVLDVNLRTPYYTRSLLEMLLAKTDILKLNLEELALITSWYSPLSDSTEQMQFLKDRFELHTIVVTCGANGAILCTGNEWYRCKGLRVNVADTVGSGDAFLAGIISKTIDGATPEEALHFANQLAAFITTQKGACPDYEIEQVYAMFKQHNNINFEMNTFS